MVALTFYLHRCASVEDWNAGETECGIYHSLFDRFSCGLIASEMSPSSLISVGGDVCGHVFFHKGCH